MSALRSALKAAPLCCCFIFLAAAEDDCTIRIIGPGEPSCVDRDEFCPDLQCDEFRTNSDGCEICECAGAEGEGEGEGEECRDDADCRDGQLCQLFEDCPPCVNGDPACEVACQVHGICVDQNPRCDDGPLLCDALPPVCPPNAIAAVQNGCWACVDPSTCREPPPPPGCFDDFDCGPGAMCIFDDTNCRPDGSGLVACAGQCVPVVSCANVLCDDRSTCVETPNGPQCVPVDGQCQADTDCGPNAHCELTCAVDPSCPNCDACMVVGFCVEDACPALCGPGAECVIRADGSIGCEPIQPPCMSDAECANGQVCNANDICLPPPGCDPTDPNSDCASVCTGFCVDPGPTGCFEDADCAADEICVLETACPPCGNNDPACLAPCFVDGHCEARP